jgi:RimJ/RimL family protein N-acetyltransferase
LRLRNVEGSDMGDLLKWRNHPVIRENSFSTNAISLNEHERWFKKKIKDPSSKIYIACCGDGKIGMIRFDDYGDVIKVSVMLNPDFLGKGLGSEVIRLGTKRFMSEKRPCKPIIAEIKKGNITSIKAFQKAAFKESHSTFVYTVHE